MVRVWVQIQREMLGSAPWTMKSSHDHFGLHQGNKSHNDHGVRGPQNSFLKASLFTDMVHWVLRWERQKRCYSRKRQGSMSKKWYYNSFLMTYFLGGRENKDKRMVKLYFSFLFKIALFEHILKRSRHSLPHPILHLARHPKALGPWCHCSIAWMFDHHTISRMHAWSMQDLDHGASLNQDK